MHSRAHDSSRGRSEKLKIFAAKSSNQCIFQISVLLPRKKVIKNFRVSRLYTSYGKSLKSKKLPNDMVPTAGMNSPLTCVRIFNALNDVKENEKEAAYLLLQN